MTRLQAELGLDRLPAGIFAAGAVLWVIILIALFLGLLWTIASAALHGPALIPGGPDRAALHPDSLAALTATLGAVVALPLTLIKVRLTRQQTDTAEEALFNDKINAAATDLAARRQVTRVVEHGKAACSPNGRMTSSPAPPPSTGWKGWHRSAPTPPPASRGNSRSTCGNEPGLSGAGPAQRMPRPTAMRGGRAA